MFKILNMLVFINKSPPQNLVSVCHTELNQPTHLSITIFYEILSIILVKHIAIEKLHCSALQY